MFGKRFSPDRQPPVSEIRLPQPERRPGEGRAPSRTVTPRAVEAISVTVVPRSVHSGTWRPSGSGIAALRGCNAAGGEEADPCASGPFCFRLSEVFLVLGIFSENAVFGVFGAVTGVTVRDG